jgi:hypothetical protein
MPKENVDYSNTIIYKIYCRDVSITDVYVGHTTNFIQRKYSHKVACNNLKNNLKIYNIIRSNGGWENWDMVEIAKYCCKNVTESRIKEQQHSQELQANLNSTPPHVDIIKYFCSSCNLQCYSPNQYNKHIACNKHIKNADDNETKISQQNETLYCCNFCHYTTSYSKDYKKHLLTKKHLFMSMKTSGITEFLSCEQCNKEFKTNSGLWKHKNNKDCFKQTTQTNKEEPSDKELFLILLKQQSELIKENSELRKEQANIKELILEIFKNGTYNNITNNTNT